MKKQGLLGLWPPCWAYAILWGPVLWGSVSVWSCARADNSKTYGIGLLEILNEILYAKHSSQCLTHVCACELSLQLCVTLGDTMDCSPPGSSLPGVLQARILEWVAMPFSRDSSGPRIEPLSLSSPALAGGFFTNSVTWEAHLTHSRY